LKNKSDLRKVFKVQFTPPLELGLNLILHCTPNRVAMFQVQSQVIRAQVSALPALVVFRLGFQLYLLWRCSSSEKMAKSDRNIFQPYWWEIIRTAPQTMWALFRWCPVPQKLSKLDRYNFKSFWREMIRTTPQTVWVCLWYKTNSSGPDFQLCLLGACSDGSGPKKFVKTWHKHFQSY